MSEQERPPWMDIKEKRLKDGRIVPKYNHAFPCECPPNARPSERCTDSGWVRCRARAIAHDKWSEERGLNFWGEPLKKEAVVLSVRDVDFSKTSPDLLEKIDEAIDKKV